MDELLKRYREQRAYGYNAKGALASAKRMITVEVKRKLLGHDYNVQWENGNKGRDEVAEITIGNRTAVIYWDNDNGFDDDWKTESASVEAEGWGRNGRQEGRFAFGMHSHRQNNVLILPHDMDLPEIIKGYGKHGSKQANIHRAIEAQDRYVKAIMEIVEGNVTMYGYTVMEKDEAGELSEHISGCGGFDDFEECKHDALSELYG